MGAEQNLVDSDVVQDAIRKHPEWYTRAVLTWNVDNRAVPQPAFNQVLITQLNDDVSDVAIAAANKLGFQQTVVPAQLPMHFLAGCVLEEFGVLEGKARQACGITRAFDRLLRGKSPRIDWKTFFGRKYRQAETKAIRWSGYLADATAWVNLMDVFCDLMLDALHRKEPSLGGYTLGNIGGTVFNLGARHLATYPKTYELAKEIHEKRGESDLSHPKKKKGKTLLGATSYIKFSYFKRAKRLASAALQELALAWPLPIRPFRTPPIPAFANADHIAK